MRLPGGLFVRSDRQYHFFILKYIDCGNAGVFFVSVDTERMEHEEQSAYFFE